MPDLRKLLELKARLDADAKAYAGYRHYGVQLYPTIRGQYFCVAPVHITAPEPCNIQTFSVSRMSRKDGHYRQFLKVEVARIAPVDAILAKITPLIEAWLDLLPANAWLSYDAMDTEFGRIHTAVDTAGRLSVPKEGTQNFGGRQ